MGALPLARGSDLVVRIGVRALAVAVVALVAALVIGWARLVPVSLLVLGGIYALQLAVDDAPLDFAAPVFAAGLVVTAELGYWSLEEQEDVKAEPGEGLRRLALVAGLGLVALLVAAGLLAFADAVRGAGLALDLVGAAAAAAALFVVLLLARRPTD